MPDSTSNQRTFKTEEKLPTPNVSVIVVCQGYRFLGYIDESGHWRAQYGNHEISGVIAWCPCN